MCIGQPLLIGRLTSHLIAGESLLPDVASTYPVLGLHSQRLVASGEGAPQVRVGVGGAARNVLRRLPS